MQIRCRTGKLNPGLLRLDTGQCIVQILIKMTAQNNDPSCEQGEMIKLKLFFDLHTDLNTSNFMAAYGSFKQNLFVQSVSIQDGFLSAKTTLILYVLS